MKRMIFVTATTALSLFAVTGNLYAQDDYFYDPNTDKANQYSAPKRNVPANPDNYSGPEDKTDGYGNDPAYRYDEKNNAYKNSYQDDNIRTANGYYDDDEDYYYTSRLRRYYTPNFGVNYYSYWFTPSFYFGWNNWNTGFFVSNNPWYNDPWWGWNRPRRTTVIIYDPWYDPFWSYNWGWNSCSYFNVWNDPWGGFCGTPGWGYNPYGWNHWGSGWGWGWGGGLYNNYWRGYNQGYWQGYRDGYWNGYNNHPYYHSPWGRTGRTAASGDNPQNPNQGNTGPGVARPRTVAPVDQPINIPREGIAKPFNPQTDIKSQDLQPGGPGKVIAPSDPKAVGRPTEVRPVQPNPNVGQFGNTGNVNDRPGGLVPRQNENVIQPRPQNPNWDQQRDVTPQRPQENIQRVPPQQMPQQPVIQQPRIVEPQRQDPPRRNVEPRQNIERIEPQSRPIEPRQPAPRMELRQNIERIEPKMRPMEPRQNIQRVEPQQRNIEQPRMQMREQSPPMRQVQPVQPRQINPSIGGAGGGRRPH